MPILPKDNRNKVADFDFGREWRGGARKNKYTYTYEKPTGESKYDDIYLPEMRRRPSLIHLLILNANGDMYVGRGYTHRMDGLSLLEQGGDIDYVILRKLIIIPC